MRITVIGQKGKILIEKRQNYRKRIKPLTKVSCLYIKLKDHLKIMRKITNISVGYLITLY